MVPCPICGALVKNSLELVAGGEKQHKCSQKKLDAIDRALKADRTEGDHRWYGQRLEDGTNED